MNLIDSIRSFLMGTRTDPANLAAFQAFSAASDRYDDAFRSIETYVERANHRHALLDAQHAVDKASAKCFGNGTKAEDAVNDAVTKSSGFVARKLAAINPEDAVNNAVAAFNEVRAACHDPADFKPYTIDYFTAHAAGMEMLAAAFEGLTVTSAAIGPTHHDYASVIAFYNLACSTYEHAIEAYRNAANCALTNALEGRLEATREEIRAYMLQARASNPIVTDAAAVTLRAAALNAKAAEDAAKFKALEEAARNAEIKADELLAGAKSAHSKVGAILESLK